LNSFKFIEAFTICKNVICETSNRSKEFDLYLQDIIDISSKYKGNVFYQYHKAFAMKVATIKLTRGLAVVSTDLTPLPWLVSVPRKYILLAELLT
jgi:hypothetical protein